jgi:hypothetical protein
MYFISAFKTEAKEGPMGITIHYRGRIKSIDLIRPLVDEVTDIAKTMKWKYNTRDEDFAVPYSAKFKHTAKGLSIGGSLSIKGISFQPHPSSEWFYLFFNKYRVLCDIMAYAFEGKARRKPVSISTKTQFAGPDVHMTVVKLLKYLAHKYFSEFKVTDEGHFWDTDDPEECTKRFYILGKGIETVGKVLRAASGELGTAKSPEALAKKLEEILEKRMGLTKISVKRVGKRQASRPR